MRYVKILSLIAMSLALFACGNEQGTTASAGVNTLNLQGGKAFRNVSSAGGNGGSISVDSFSDVKITTSGTVATTITLPTITPVFGSRHFPDSRLGDVFTGTRTVKFGTDPLVQGDLFVNLSDTNLYVANDSNPGNATIVTGLTIPSGATLVLPVNFGANLSMLIFDNSVEIDGTLKVAASASPTNENNLFIEVGGAAANASLLRVGTSGKVLTAGTGKAGGSIYLFSWGMLINQGTLDSSGGSGLNAGFIELESFGFLYNTGKVFAKGGSNLLGAGGAGGNIGMQAFNASLNTSGELDNSGGDGSSGGGDAGSITLNSGGGVSLNFGPQEGSMGRTLVGGIITRAGGNATVAGNGGNGAVGGITLESNKSGGLLVSARITANGGAASGGSNFQGGNGGNLTLFQSFGSDTAVGNEAPNEGIKLGSLINLSGGTAGLNEKSSSANLTGGNGGSVSISNDFAPNAYPPVSTTTTTSTAGLPPIELIGYVGINLSGGDAGSGGNGGGCRIYTFSPAIGNLVYPTPGISNAVAINAKGGDGNAKTGFQYAGGRGGDFDWRVGGDPANPVPGNPTNAFQEKVSLLNNTGAINASGGDGDFGGNGANNLFFYGYVVKSTGIITARGGKGTTQGGNGSGTFEMDATLSLTSSGGITTTGGSGAVGGNGGGSVKLASGMKVSNSGAILANGGAGTTTAGSGGVIELLSQYAKTSNTGSLNAAKGSGPNGVNGRIIIDFVEQA